VLASTPTIAESQLSMKDGTEIFIRDWFPGDSTKSNEQQTSVARGVKSDAKADVKPSIVILHGLGEHCGRYKHIAAFFNERGFAVRTFDHRGHGQSGADRGNCPDPMSLVDDAEVVIRDFAERCQTTPLLFGHSMGGLFASRLALSATVPLSGLILSSPALALRLTWLHRTLFKLLVAVAPNFKLPLPIKPELLSHNLDTVMGYMHDPLVHHNITANLLNSMMSAIDFVRAHAAELTIPTLLLIAGDDQIVDPQGSHDFLMRCRTSSVQYIFMPTIITKYLTKSIQIKFLMIYTIG